MAVTTKLTHIILILSCLVSYNNPKMHPWMMREQKARPLEDLHTGGCPYGRSGADMPVMSIVSSKDPTRDTLYHSQRRQKESSRMVLPFQKLYKMLMYDASRKVSPLDSGAPKSCLTFLTSLFICWDGHLVKNSSCRNHFLHEGRI